MKPVQTLILCALLGITSGCSSYTQVYESDERIEDSSRDSAETRDTGVRPGYPVEPEPGPAVTPSQPTNQTSRPAGMVSSNSAVQRLYDQAMNYAHAGDYDQAEATLERGLRIEPNNAYLWFELARLSADYGNVKKARELASRAQSLAGGNRSLQNQIERFMNGL